MSDARHVDPPVTIRAEVSEADPDSCRFTVSRSVHHGGPFLYESAEQAEGSPLPEALFALPGVARVLVAENVVTVGRRPDASWQSLTAAIGKAIRSQLLTGIPAIYAAPRPAPSRTHTDDEIRALVQQVLDGDINRSIAAHGGRISIVEVRDGRLHIAMSGGCQGCAASQVTLRKGFEVMVRKVVPGLVEIIDTTDHRAGTSPYYPGQGK